MRQCRRLRLPPSPPLELSLRVLLLEPDFERLFEDLFEVIVRILDAEDFSKTLELRREGLPRREAVVVALRGRGLENRPRPTRLVGSTVPRPTALARF